MQSPFSTPFLRSLFFYSRDGCVFLPSVSFRVIQRGARAILAKFCSYYLLPPRVRVALLICALDVTPQLLPVQGGLAAPPTTRLELIFETPQGSPFFPLNKGKGRIEEIKYPGGSIYLNSAV